MDASCLLWSGGSVIAIISTSTYKLTLKTLGSNRLLWLIYCISAVFTIVTESESISMFLGAGLVTYAFSIRAAQKQDPSELSQSLFPLVLVSSAELPRSQLLIQIATFFAKAGTFVFGSGLAIVPFLYGGVVKEYGWLNEQEFLDAVAVAMITPGPVVITVGFIGYLVTGREGGFCNGVQGASVAAIATFLPCYLLTVIPAPYFKKHGKRPGIVAFVDGVTSAAVGAIAGSCVVLARRTLVHPAGYPDWPKLVLLTVTLVLLLRYKKFPEPIIILLAAICGLVIYPMVR